MSEDGSIRVFDLRWVGVGFGLHAHIVALGNLSITLCIQFTIHSILHTAHCRDKEHSTIIFETDKQPLLRLGWNPVDPRYIAALVMDTTQTVVLDIR